MDKRVVAGAVMVVVLVVAVAFNGVRGGGGKGSGAMSPTPVVPASPLPSAVASVAPAEGTAVAVTVSYTGEPPAPRKIKKTPECHVDTGLAGTIGVGTDPLVDEALVVRDRKLQNVLVRVIEGAPVESGSGLGATVVQSQCVYSPRVSGIVAGQSIAVTSRDNFLHNVHTFAGSVSIFNKGQPTAGTFVKEAADFEANGKRIDDGPITFKCDVHPWMISTVVVNPNRHFAVTGPDGAAALTLPPGTYGVEAWHETLGAKKASLTVVAGQPATLAIAFP